MTKPATKSVGKMLTKLEINEKKVLFIIDQKATNLLKSIRNLPLAIVKLDNQVSTKDIVNAKTVILMDNCIESLRKAYQ